MQYFYVFGPDGDPLMGAEGDNELTLFIDIPEKAQEDVIIDVFDPDAGGKKDWLAPTDNGWNTITRFSVYGENLLKEKEFSRESDYSYYRFGPYLKKEGQKIPAGYRFRLVAKGINGDDANLFKVRIYPDNAEVFSYKITFRLNDTFGSKMYFYPQVSSGTRLITVENYDLDKDGGTSLLFDRASWGSWRELMSLSAKGKYNINDSESGKWNKTEINLADAPTRRLEYVITKGTQRYAHAGLRFFDAQGNSLPIYFTKSRIFPVIAAKPYLVKPLAVNRQCNVYTFDATGSYDPDQHNLEYLWDFGDGESSTKPVVTHEFKQAGEYTVTLTVVDNSGLECDTAITSQKVVVNTPPQASFSAPKSACLGEEIALDATASTDNTPETLTYRWDFGDGTGAEGKRVSKKFTKAGKYKLILEVDDNSNTACHLDRVEHILTVNTPPRAAAGKDIDMCLENFKDAFNIVFDASGSTDPDNDTLTYLWDFGDGQQQEGKRLSHTYDKSGTYEVVLTVKDSSDSSCNMDKDTLKVSLNRRPGADAGENKFACSGEPVSFKGNAGSAIEGLLYNWDFGDGTTAQAKEVEHTYKAGVQYKVSLTVDDGKKTPCSLSVDFCNVSVNTAPNAKVADVAVHCAGSQVSFDASASSDSDGDQLSYSWDFGDGTVEKAGARVNHTYTKGGLYTVSVTVDDARTGKCSSSRDVTVCKINTPPVADAGSNLVCCEGKVAHFDGSRSYDPDGDELTYSWDFGDGEKANGPIVEHTYKKRGTYNVVLTVDDGSGTRCSSAQAGFSAVVSAMPVPVIKIR